MNTSDIISTILKHDTKVTSYKIALLRAINDVALSFPDLYTHDKDIAVPVKVLAEYWLVYYWPFVKIDQPILQGPRSLRNGKLANDMAFRDELAEFRLRWEKNWGGSSKPSDGYFVINELRVPRKRKTYPSELLRAYERALNKISHTINQPIRYAGPGEYTVFKKPVRYNQLRNVVALPGTSTRDVCLVVNADLWRGFQRMSLYIEALSIHEWCLFTENVEQGADVGIDRGSIYKLLTERPDNRRPLTWERNQIDILLMENKEFVCPWTEKRIYDHVNYDVDHLVPVSVYPINEIWNLVPVDPYYNSHVKRDRIPSESRLLIARPHLTLAYENYNTLPSLAQALVEDTKLRFSRTQVERPWLPEIVAESTINFIRQISISRNLPQF
jgi:hypothetical protein